jgi:hypothetical protein
MTQFLEGTALDLPYASLSSLPMPPERLLVLACCVVEKTVILGAERL